MGIILILILAAALYKAKTLPPRDFRLTYDVDYLSFERTTAVKGVFILLIFLTHSAQYVTVGSDGLAWLYNAFRSSVGQGVVTMFFFYSGYGVLESVKKNGGTYIKQFPKNRILKILVHFDIAVLLYLVLSLVRGKTYNIADYLLSLIGWSALGNSNWFVFDILAAYLLTFAAFSVFKKSGKLFSPVVVTMVLSLAFVVLMFIFKPSRFYNTFLCYSLGMWWSFGKAKFEKILFCHKLVPTIAMVFLLGAFALLGNYNKNAVWNCGQMLVFTLFTVLLTSRVKIDNQILAWYGKASFSIFIIMRIPMIILSDLGVANDKYLFVFLSFILTTALAYGYDQLLGVVDRKLFARVASKSKM